MSCVELHTFLKKFLKFLKFTSSFKVCWFSVPEAHHRHTTQSKQPLCLQHTTTATADVKAHTTHCARSSEQVLTAVQIKAPRQLPPCLLWGCQPGPARVIVTRVDSPGVMTAAAAPPPALCFKLLTHTLCSPLPAKPSCTAAAKPFTPAPAAKNPALPQIQHKVQRQCMPTAPASAAPASPTAGTGHSCSP